MVILIKFCSFGILLFLQACPRDYRWKIKAKYFSSAPSIRIKRSFFYFLKIIEKIFYNLSSLYLREEKEISFFILLNYFHQSKIKLFSSHFESFISRKRRNVTASGIYKKWYWNNAHSNFPITNFRRIKFFVRCINGFVISCV